jgi:GDP-D-mannose dehydratase
VRVRPFNHTGPGHDARFVIPGFARQLAEFEAGMREPVLRVGNLDVARDFTDVRDMVRAYRLALIEGVPGDVYNIGSGRAVLLSDIVDELVGFCSVRVERRENPSLRRAADIPYQQADVRKFTARTGCVMKPGQATVIDCELQDASAVRGVVRAVRPDRIFHLAAQSFVPTGWTAKSRNAVDASTARSSSSARAEIWRGRWGLIACQCEQSGDTGGAEDFVQVDSDFGYKLGHQLCARAASVARDQQAGAINEGTLLDQVDDPDFVQIVT